MGLQHDIPHERFQGHGGVGLLCCWGECAIWDVLYANPGLPNGSGRSEDEVGTASMDRTLHRTVRRARYVFEMVPMGLLIQYGCECCGWGSAERAVELVQLQEVHEVRAGVGHAARIGCRVDYSCDELGAVGFPAAVGMLGCA